MAHEPSRRANFEVMGGQEVTRCIQAFDQDDPGHRAALREAASLAVLSYGGTEGLIQAMHDGFGIQMDYRQAFDALCSAEAHQFRRR